MKRTYVRSIAAMALLSASSIDRAPGQQTDFGVVDFPTSGAPAAQPHFLRGLALLHDFEYDQAAEAFREAQRIDAAFALAYWGEAMTYNHSVWMQQDSVAARAVLAKLGPSREARLARAKTARERDYLAAVEVLYGMGDKKTRDFAYRDAMQLLMQNYPDDEDAATFYALALLGTAHDGRDVPTYMRAAAVAEEVFRAYPQHPGAVHYLIHTYDDPVHAPLGLRAARTYARIAPKAGHAQHMTSHIFIAIGMWDDMVLANENAMRVVNAGRQAHGHGPAGCGHYNFWLEYGYLMQGRQADARRLLDECRTAVGAGSVPWGNYVMMRARWLLDTEEWRGDVAMEAITARMIPSMTHANDFLDAYTAVRRGDRTGAVELLARMRKTREGFVPSPLDPSAGPIAEVKEAQIEALLLSGEGKHDAAVQLMRTTADREAKLPYEFGPPFVDKPSHELLGELLLGAGKAKEAAAAFGEALTRAPLRVNSLRGLMRSADAAGNAAKAAQARQQIESIQRGR